MGKPIISITMGDPAGIGAEIAVKALSKREMYNLTIPVVIGSKAVMEDAISFIPANVSLNVIEDIKRKKSKVQVRKAETVFK